MWSLINPTHKKSFLARTAGVILIGYTLGILIQQLHSSEVGSCKPHDG